MRLFLDGSTPVSLLTLLSQGGHDILAGYIYALILTSLSSKTPDPLILKISTLSITDPQIEGS